MIIGIQARSNSTRYRHKIYKKFIDKTLLETVVDACSIEGVRVVILGPHKDVKLRNFCKKHNLELLQPDENENNLLGRYSHLRDDFIRITSDCPLMPKKMILAAIKLLSEHDYVTNTSPRTFADGFDVQGIKKEAFDWYKQRVKTEEHLFYELENNCHLQTDFMRLFKIKSMISADEYIANPHLEAHKLSVDTKEDLLRIRSYAKMAR